jgi:hypothetical protein
MQSANTPSNSGDTLRDVLENYRTYLARNPDLSDHLTQFLRREKSDQRAAEAEAAVFSWLRAEKREPRLFEKPGTGGPDYSCAPTGVKPFLVEVTSLDSEMVAKRSGLPMEITGSGGSSYAQITEKLKAKAQDKGRQLSGQGMPTVLAIASDHAFASLLMSNLAAEYLMTSAPQIKVPFGGGGQSYITYDFKHSAFRRNTGLVSASGAPIIKAHITEHKRDPASGNLQMGIAICRLATSRRRQSFRSGLLADDSVRKAHRAVHAHREPDGMGTGRSVAWGGNLSTSADSVETHGDTCLRGASS